MGRERPIRRLGLFVDAAFHRRPRGEVLCGDELFGFMSFACAVGARFERFVVIAREASEAAEAPGEWHPLPVGVSLAPLPHYESLRRLGRVAAALPGTCAAMWRALDELDAVWVSGVHPLGLLLVALAALRRRRIVLLIRQDSPRYFRSRLPSRAWAPLLIPLRLLTLCFVALSRLLATTVVGQDLAGRYGAPRSNLLVMHVTLVQRDELAAGPSSAEWSGRFGCSLSAGSSPRRPRWC